MRADWSSSLAFGNRNGNQRRPVCDRQCNQPGRGKPQRVVTQFTAGETIALAQRGHASGLRGVAQRIETAVDTKLDDSALGIRIEDNRASRGDVWLGAWIDASGEKPRQIISEVAKPHGLVTPRLRSHSGVGQ